MISASDFSKAKSVEGVKMVEALEQQLACSPSEFVQRLGETLRMRVATLEELLGAEPAFDLLP